MVNPYQSPQAESAGIAPASRTTACPHCGGVAVSLFLKSRMGPFRDRNCKQCGGRIGIQWRWALISSLGGMAAPFALLAIAYVVANDDGRLLDQEIWQSNQLNILIGIGILTSLVGGAIQVGVQTMFAPLVKKSARKKPVKK